VNNVKLRDAAAAECKYIDTGQFTTPKAKDWSEEYNSKDILLAPLIIPRLE
jgi:hypothetical protein